MNDLNDILDQYGIPDINEVLSKVGRKAKGQALRDIKKS